MGWTDDARRWIDEHPKAAVWPRTAQEFARDQSPLYAAALAFFALFALAPVVALVLLGARWLYGSSAQARANLQETAATWLGEDKAQLVQQVVANASPPGGGVVATVVGVAVLLYAASRLFTYLEASLNRIWDVEPREDRSLARTLRKRAVAFGLVLLAAAVLLASLVLTSLLSGAFGAAQEALPWDAATLAVLRYGVLLVVATGLFMLLYTYLPDAQVPWRDVVVGSVVTAVLTVLGQAVIGRILAGSTLTNAFGGLATVAVILLWFYYTGLVFLFGAEFTQVWARLHGHRVEPEEALARARGRKRGLARGGA